MLLDDLFVRRLPIAAFALHLERGEHVGQAFGIGRGIRVAEVQGQEVTDAPVNKTYRPCNVI